MDQNRSHSHRSTRASLLPNGSTFRASMGGYKHKSLVLEAAYNEYVKIRKGGTQVDIQEFCERFPDYRKSIRRMIEVEEFLPAGDDPVDDGWPEIGGSFLGFDLLEMLGSGSIAKVYLAAEVQLGGRLVALKVSHHGGYEAETLGKLRHPNIVEVYSVQQDQQSGLTAVCMPYQGTATLADVLDVAYREKQTPQRAGVISDVAQKWAIAESQPDKESARPDRVLELGTFVDGIVHLGRQLASALQYAHDRGILHRDLKPSNVLLTPQGWPMLLDFNLSYDAAINFNPGGGTLPYAAPEQLRETAPMTALSDTTLDVRADVFSLGVILYELLTGELPFGAPPPSVGPKQAIQMQLEALQEPAPPISSLNKQVDAELARVIHRCLEADPAKRFATAAELETALRRYFRPTLKVKRWVGRHPVAAAAPLLATLITLLALGLYFSTRPPKHQLEVNAAKASHKSHDLPAVVFHLSNAVNAKEDNSELLVLRGHAFLEMKNYESAAEDFSAAYAKGLDTEALNDAWGFSLFHQKRFEDAYFAYQRAVKHHDNDVSLRLKKAYSLYKTDGVVPDEDLEIALSHESEKFEAQFLRAVCGFQCVRTRTDKKSARLRSQAIARAAADIRSATTDQQKPRLSVFEYFAAVIIAAASVDNPELKPEVESHLKECLKLGLPVKLLSANAELEPWKNEPWFKDRDAQSAMSHADINTMLDSVWITPPASPPIP